MVVILTPIVLMVVGIPGYIYIYAQREKPFCHPHGQKVGQGCGEALFTEDTTLTRGWIGR